jgi:tetratricopeptide (TPR) repeat protein
MTCFAADRLVESVAANEKVLELAPQRAVARASLAIVLLGLGRTEAALAEALREPEEWGRLYALAIVHHAAGRASDSDEALRTLAARYAGDAAYQVAEVHAARGEADPAFDWLERAFAQRDPGVVWTKIDPLLRPLHADPRWAAFVRKLRLAE